MLLDKYSSVGISFVFVLIWFNIYYFVKKILIKKYEDKNNHTTYKDIISENIIKNIIHIINALNTIVWSITNIFNDKLYILFFIAFYMFDIIYIIANLEIKKNISNIIHHIMAITCSMIPLLDESFITNYKELGFILEFSNIPLYINYHFHKVYPNNKTLLEYATLFQFLIYGFFRIIMFGIYLYYKILIYPLDSIFNIVLCFSSTMIYIMGIIWTYKLLVKVKNIFLSNNKNN